MINFLFKKRFNSSVASCYVDFIQAGGILLTVFMSAKVNMSMFDYLFFSSYIAFSFFCAYIQKKNNYTHVRQTPLAVGIGGVFILVIRLYSSFI